MHIAEGFLPVGHAIGWTVVAAPFVVHGAVQLVKTVKAKPQTGLLLAAAGAFTFVLSALKMPSVTGSSSHPTGTGLGATLFKPPIMAAIATLVLIFQALFLAHGGITTLGANVFSMGIVGPWVGYAGFVMTRKLNGGILPAVFVAAVLADWSTYVVTSIELALAFPETGQAWMTGVGLSAGKFLGVFAITQIPLAIVEGIITVLVVRALIQIAKPELNLLGFFTRGTGKKEIESTTETNAVPVAATTKESVK